MQIKTRVAGVPAVSAAAIAIMDGPAFAPNNPVTGNILGNGNIADPQRQQRADPGRHLRGKAVGLLGFANASCVGGAAALLDDSGN